MLHDNWSCSFSIGVHIIFQEKTNYLEFKKQFDSLYPDQQEFIQEQFYTIAELYVGPKPKTPTIETIDPDPTPNAVMACDPGAAPYCWKQPIQEDNAPTSATKISPRAYYTNQYSCDDKDDTDYIFYFSYNSNNPDAIRFTATTSIQVAAALSFEAINLDGEDGLNSYGYNNIEVRLCVGDNGTWAAGGATNIMNHLKLYNR